MIETTDQTSFQKDQTSYTKIQGTSSKAVIRQVTKKMQATCCIKVE